MLSVRRRLPAAVVIVAALLLAALLTTVTGLVGGSGAQAQVGVGPFTMQDRLDQVIATLQGNPAEDEASAAIAAGMEVLYGGIRPLPSPDVPEAGNASDAVGAAEHALAAALEAFVQSGPANNPAKGAALDLKLFIEEMNEVAAAVGAITQQCGNGNRVDQAPCDQLRPLLDEDTGQVRNEARIPARIKQGFTVKLRGPRVVPWFANDTWDEEVRVTEPIASGECSVVVKETKGLAVQLRFQRIILVNDPWVATFGLPRGTAIPIWTMEWIPSQYIKTINLCNNAGVITQTVSQRVVQDPALNWFWRFYPAGAKQY